MKINQLYQFLIVGILVSTTGSCKKFLDLQPISTATTGNAYNTADDAEAALIGTYSSFTINYYIWQNINLSDVIADNAYAGGDNPNLFELDATTILPTNTVILDTWTGLYSGIKRANIVLAKVPAINDPKFIINGRKDQILGEAAFIRAFHYYQLVKAYGGVPLMLDPVESADPVATNKPRASVSDVYTQIITDLQFALQRLPDTYGTDASVNKGRATKGAANALLAKVYAQKPDRDYSKVLDYCNAVVNSTAGYTLLATYDFLFDAAHYNNAESILEQEFLSPSKTNFGPQLVLPPSKSAANYRKFITPSKDLAKTFDNEGDVIRKASMIYFETVPFSDEYWALGGGSVPFSYKWRTTNGSASTNREYLLRLGDIVLLKAEALNELGRTPEAAVEVNRIRTRVKLANTPATTQATMRLAIEKERRLELAMEGQRWDDLRRYGRAIDVMNSVVEIDLRTNTRVNYNMTVNKQLLPLPQQELDRNNLMVQNPGY